LGLRKSSENGGCLNLPIFTLTYFWDGETPPPSKLKPKFTAMYKLPKVVLHVPILITNIQSCSTCNKVKQVIKILNSPATSLLLGETLSLLI